MSSIDETFMRGALAIARRGLGSTWPNPAVGAVIVRPGSSPETIARGWTARGGRPHAERIALGKVNGEASGCTLYVTLEPCAHRGKTGPCADAVIAAGISRVVCSFGDPDPRMAGAGFARLREAGIEVVENVLEAEGRKTVEGHIMRVTRHRPFVQLKLAVGKDRRIPRGHGKPVWATGEAARAHGHLMRARADAILVGSGTVSADDPELTCRLPGMRDDSPVRIVLDQSLKLSAESRLAKTIDVAPLWIACSQHTDDERESELRSLGAELIPVSQRGEGNLLDLEVLLAQLAQRGITRLLIEGGPRVAAGFWSRGLVDEVLIYKGTHDVGSDGIIPFDGAGIEVIEKTNEFAPVETRSLDGDTVTRFAAIQA